MPNNENNYWNIIQNSLWIVDQWSYEATDIAVGVHLGESVLAGIATAAAVKRGNVAARYLIPKSARPGSRRFRAEIYGTNVAAGMTTAALTSYCLTTKADKQELTNRIVHAPLMPAMSPSSDLFCERAIEACKRNEKDISPEVEMFAENCQLRRDYEDKLRVEQGVADDDAVSIPFPGVPTKALLDESVIAMKAKFLVWDGGIMDASLKPSSFNTEEEDLLFVDDFLDMPVFAGIGIGIASFLLLRKVPHRVLLHIRPYWNDLVAKRGYSLDPPPKSKRNVLIRAPKLGFDVCVSFLTGFVAASLHQYYIGRLPRHVVESPLVAGRSLVSDYMCEEIVEDYKHMQSSFETSDHQSLRHLSAAIYNCQQRQAYEQELRRAKGLEKDAPVSIPPPGVPNGITRDAIDKAWAESLLTHREMTDATSNDNAPQPSE